MSTEYVEYVHSMQICRRVDSSEAHAERQVLREQLDRAYDTLRLKRTEERNMVQDIAQVTTHYRYAHAAVLVKLKELLSRTCPHGQSLTCPVVALTCSAAVDLLLMAHMAPGHTCA